MMVALACFTVSSPVLAQQADEASSSPAASSPAADYRIGPGDTLDIRVWRQPELSAQLPVRPDGKISIQMVDDMVAVGKTPTELARDMEAVLAQYYRAPQVSVLITNFVGVVASQIRVLGEVVRPGAVAYRDGLTLLDVMLEVGGMTEFASGRRAELTRTVDGKVEKIPVRLDRLLEHGDTEENLPMQPGDLVTVPPARF